MTEPFDLRTHIRDPKSGRIVVEQPYRLYVQKDGGKVFERPPGSGNKFYENGEKVPEKEPEVLMAAKMEVKVENKTEAKTSAKKE